jgi:hypothetical protein
MSVLLTFRSFFAVGILALIFLCQNYGISTRLILEYQNANKMQAFFTAFQIMLKYCGITDFYEI